MTDADPRAGEGAGKLGDDAHAVLSAVTASASAYYGTLRALRELFLAEVGLARHAITQGMVLLMLATVMVATTWGLLTALIVTGIRATGASWTLAIAVPMLLSVLIGAAAAYRAYGLMRYLDFESTRRQIKLGIKGLPSQPPSAGDQETAP